VSFHSLEDRIVKQFFKLKSGGMARNSRFLPEAAQGDDPTFEMIIKGGKKPKENEIQKNPRSRSAKLRAGRRTEVIL
jgi:16S rRNA (cytosine1402-N4)-methyltransferase